MKSKTKTNTISANYDKIYKKMRKVQMSMPVPWYRRYDYRIVIEGESKYYKCKWRDK
ncbi:MAG: hypothetical protein ACOCRK_03080 [bacterium]